MPTPLVTLDSICKSFGSLQILKEITLTIHQGEITSIVGPSGAGKTTLLQIIGTLLKPDKGELSIDGVNPFALSAQKQAHFRNKQIGFVFQFHQLLPEFTAAENVAIPAMIAGMSKRQALSEAEQLLTQLGLADRLKHRPAQLSGGEKQRTAVARALINRPTLILADGEPRHTAQGGAHRAILRATRSARTDLPDRDTRRRLCAARRPHPLTTRWAHHSRHVRSRPA